MIFRFANNQLRMTRVAKCIGLLLAFITAVAAQQNSSPAQRLSKAEPALPVIQRSICVGRVAPVRNWKIRSPVPLFSSWHGDRKQMGELQSGENVTVTSGTTITKEPDRISVTRPIPELSLKSGDTMLRYESSGEIADIWSNGVWHNGYHVWKTTEKDGSGCNAKDTCNSLVTENGVKEWWIQVKTAEGRSGWVLDRTNDRGQFKDSGNFDGLCGD